MIEKLKFACLLLAIVAQACTPDENQTSNQNLPHQIDLTHFSKRNLYLSDIADDISYIKLETHQDYMIGDFVVVNPCEEGFVIRAFQQTLGIFSEEGKFIRRIGSRGTGPGEYQYTNMVIVDKDSGSLFFQADGRPIFYQYALDGQLLNTYEGNVFRSGYSIELWQGVFVAPHGFELKDSSFISHSIVSTSGDVVYDNEVQIPAGLGEVGRTPQALLSGYNDSLFLYNLFRDTVYYFETPYKLKPFAILDRGQVMLEFEDRFERRSYKSPDPDKYLFSFKNRGPFILMVINSEPEPISMFYDVKQKALYQFENNGLQKQDSIFGIENDLDGGPVFYFHHTTDETYGYCVVQAIDLIQMKESGYFDRVEAKQPEKQAELLKLISTLTVEDNPVIMKVKFKSGNR